VRISMTGMVSAHDAELARIRAEYERRGRELPADFYGWNRPVNLFRHCQALRSCIRALAREGMFPLDGRSVADIGCGRGQWLAEFLQWGADGCSLCGIDLAEDRIQAARKRVASADLRLGDACRLPWTDAAFDLVTQFTLLTSVLDMGVKRQIASEMLRVLKLDGLILWYDFRCNNPRNPNVRGIDAKEIRSLFPGCVVKLKKLTLAPPVARRVVPLSWIAALVLEAVPLLRTHYLAVIRKQH
jgi:SAM-dependent methyltransferase